MFPLATLRAVYLNILDALAYRTELLNADQIWDIYRGLIRVPVVLGCFEIIEDVQYSVTGG